MAEFYFGTGGLVRAYSESTINAIEKAEKIEIELGTEYEIKVEYTNFSNIQYYFQKNNIEMYDTKYEENIISKIKMSDKIKQKFIQDIQNKELKINEIKELQQLYIKNKTQKD